MEIENLYEPHNGNIDRADKIIKAQAREIRELQATICRLKSEYLEKQVNYEAVISRTRDEAVRIVAEQRLARQVDDEARRIRDLGDD